MPITPMVNRTSKDDPLAQIPQFKLSIGSIYLKELERELLLHEMLDGVMWKFNTTSQEVVFKWDGDRDVSMVVYLYFPGDAVPQGVAAMTLERPGRPPLRIREWDNESGEIVTNVWHRPGEPPPPPPPPGPVLGQSKAARKRRERRRRERQARREQANSEDPSLDRVVSLLGGDARCPHCGT